MPRWCDPLAAIVLATLLIACRPAGDAPVPAPAASEAAQASAPPPRQKVRVAYAALAATFATPWMAKEAGLFEKYGLDVDLSYIASGPTLIQAMTAGELDFGDIAAPSPMSAYLEGGETVWISGTVNRPVVFVVAAPEIARLDDLRGRSMGVTRIGTVSHTFTKLALRAAGIDPERDVNILQTGGLAEAVGGLASGRIQGAVIGPPMYLNALQEGMHVVADLTRLGIAWPFAGAVATRSGLAAQPERASNYLKAYVEALHLLRTDRERSIDVIAKYSEASDRATAARTWEVIVPNYTLPPYPDRAALETVVREELLATNEKARDVPLEAYYDDRPLRALESSGFIRAVTGE